MAKKLSILGLVLLVSLYGCGGDGGDDDDDNNNVGNPPVVGGSPTPTPTPVSGDSASVTSLSTGGGQIAVGGSGTVTVRARFSSDRVFAGGEHIIVGVRLPNGVGYQEESATATTRTQNVRPAVTDCAGGETYVVFDLEASELDGASQTGNDNVDVSFGIEGREQAGAQVIEAAAANNSLPHACGADFDAQATTGIIVQ